jgi:integrase
LRGRRRFGSVRKLRSGRWQVRYRSNDGVTHLAPQTFPTSTDAEKYLSTIESDMLRGDWLNPTLAKMTIEEWSERWLAGISHVKPKTLAYYRNGLNTHVLPRFGRRPAIAITPNDVRRMAADMAQAGFAPGTISSARKVLRMVLALAVEEGAIRRNPCDGVKVARSAPQEMLFLTPEQVEALAREIEWPPHHPSDYHREHRPEYALLVRLAAYTGLRAGELEGLRVGRVDLRRGTLEIRETVGEVGGQLVFGTTKTHTRRSVRVPESLRLALVDHLAGRSDVDGFVFTAHDGGPIRHRNFYARHFKPAVRRAGLPEGLRFHDLRHTCAAMLIAEGAHPRAIMERLGHSSITVTLNTYGHLLPAIDEALTDRLNDRFNQARRHPGTSRERTWESGPDIGLP